jgi:predicted HicB family RNase H-like nuclease
MAKTVLHYSRKKYKRRERGMEGTARRKRYSDLLFVRVPGQVKRALFEMAKQRGLTVSDLIRLSLERTFGEELKVSGRK